MDIGLFLAPLQYILDIIGSHVDIYYLIQTYPKQQMSRILDAPNPPPHQGLMMIILGTDKTS
jgi:hypothetical protein